MGHPVLVVCALRPVLPFGRRFPPQEHRGRRRRRVRGMRRGRRRHGDVSLRRRERRLWLRLEEAAEDPLESVARRQVEQGRCVPGKRRHILPVMGTIQGGPTARGTASVDIKFVAKCNI